mgnify:CR=1 FL=1
MSTLKVNNLQNIGGTDLLAPIQSGSLDAWISFNGAATIAIHSSFNISSVTDNGTGNYTINFSTSFATTNIAYFFGQGRTDSNIILHKNTLTSRSASNLRICTTFSWSSGGVRTDCTDVNVGVIHP